MSAILQQFLPKARIIPKLQINYYADAQRVKVEGSAYPTPALPATTLELRYMNTTNVAGWNVICENYALVDQEGDLEAYLAVWKEGGTTHWEVSRCGGREFKIYFDDALMVTWPIDTTIGYWGHGETA